MLQKVIYRLVLVTDSFAFEYECKDDGILVKVDSKYPYTGALYGLYDFFTCRVEPKDAKRIEYFFPSPTVSKNCSDSIRYKVRLVCFNSRNFVMFCFRSSAVKWKSWLDLPIAMLMTAAMGLHRNSSFEIGNSYAFCSCGYSSLTQISIPRSCHLFPEAPTLVLGNFLRRSPVDIMQSNW